MKTFKFLLNLVYYVHKIRLYFETIIRIKSFLHCSWLFHLFNLFNIEKSIYAIQVIYTKTRFLLKI